MNLLLITVMPFEYLAILISAHHFLVLKLCEFVCDYDCVLLQIINIVIRINSNVCYHCFQLSFCVNLFVKF